MIKQYLTLLVLVVTSFGLIHADTNGVWLLAQDLKSGVFASDEDGGDFTFTNNTYFGGELRDLANPGLYYINLPELSQFNDLRSNLLTSNSLEINGNGSLTGNLEVSGSTIVTSLETTSIDSTSLSVSTTSGDAISSDLESGTGSAVYGYYSGSDLGYSGYFEGGSFRVDSVGDVFLSSSTGDVMSNKFRITSFSNCEEIYADVNGHLRCRTTGDIDSNNELQTLSKIGSTISLSDGGSVNLQDDSATNELQTLSRSGTDITLSNGGGIISVADNDNNPNNELQNLNQVLSQGNNAGFQKITNLGSPTSDADAATKSYVDDNVGNFPSGLFQVRVVSGNPCYCGGDEVRTGCAGKQGGSYDTYASGSGCRGESGNAQCICLKVS